MPQDGRSSLATAGRILGQENPMGDTSSYQQSQHGMMGNSGLPGQNSPYGQGSSPNSLAGLGGHPTLPGQNMIPGQSPSNVHHSSLPTVGGAQPVRFARTKGQQYPQVAQDALPVTPSALPVPQAPVPVTPTALQTLHAARAGYSMAQQGREFLSKVEKA